MFASHKCDFFGFKSKLSFTELAWLALLFFYTIMSPSAAFNEPPSAKAVATSPRAKPSCHQPEWSEHWARNTHGGTRGGRLWNDSCRLRVQGVYIHMKRCAVYKWKGGSLAGQCGADLVGWGSPTMLNIYKKGAYKNVQGDSSVFPKNPEHRAHRLFF